MKFARMIDEHGRAEKFEKASKRKKAFVSVHPDTVNFVKDFIADNKMHDHPIGKHIVKTKDKAPQLHWQLRRHYMTANLIAAFTDMGMWLGDR